MVGKCDRSLMQLGRLGSFLIVGVYFDCLPLLALEHAPPLLIVVDVLVLLLPDTP
jgi:hypothetical protein